MQAARVGGTVAKPRGLKPQAVKAKTASASNGKAMRAAKNYQKAASAMSRGAMSKRTDVSLATASRALDFYRGKPITGKRKGLTASGKGVKPATPKATVYRTRKQAAAAQRDRSRQIAEIGGRLRKSGAAQSLSRKAVKVNQRNLLTGGIDRVTANVTTRAGGTRIGSSSFAKKTQRRMDRVGSRIDSLVAQRRSLPQRPRKVADQRAALRTDRRLATMSRAADVYRRARPGRRR